MDNSYLLYSGLCQMVEDEKIETRVLFNRDYSFYEEIDERLEEENKNKKKNNK